MYEKITVSKLKDILLNLKSGANFVTVQTITPHDMNKGGRNGVAINPYFGKVFKVATVNVQLQSDYENAVNLQRKREGKPANFVAAAPTWGQRVGDTCVVEHNGEFYMAYRAVKCIKVHYINEKGHFVSVAALEPWKKEKSKNTRQGTDTEIIWRKPKLVHVRKIHINKKKYEVI